MFWSQFVSVCFTMKLFFYFKIHCLQTLQLFQTTDGPIFFIVTLVYTCSALFATLSTSVIIVSVKEWFVFFSNFCRDGHKTFLFNKLCSKCQSWRRYLLQFSHCYGVTKMQPSGNLLSFYAVSTLALWFRRRRFLKGFYHIWAWRPSWSCDPDAPNKLSFPQHMEAPHEIWLWLAQGFWRSLKMVDGRTTEHAYTISSPMNLKVQVS